MGLQFSVEFMHFMLLVDEPFSVVVVVEVVVVVVVVDDVDS